MHFRLFSHKQKLYTNSLFWPSNQRTWSEWTVTQDGRILEIIFDGTAGHDSDPIGCQYHDSRNFSIEPWTGLHDIEGKKIYLGDILEFKVFDLKHEVRWLNGEFIAFDLKEESALSNNARILQQHTITGNIHGVEYCD